jgi:multidrug efflux pump subunit AcrB
MKISEYSVKNFQFTLIMFLMAIVLGIVTLFTMPRCEDPELQAPFYTIVVVYPGTTPEDMEQLVVDPLEDRINELEDVKRVRANISDGLAVVRIEYKYESNIDEKYQELIREVNSLRNELPGAIASIDVQKFQASDVNVIQVALLSENASRRKLKQHAEALKEDLEKLPNLKNVEIHGLPEEIIRIDLDLKKIAQMNIPVEAITGSLQSEAANIPAGSVIAGPKTFNIKTSGKYSSLDEIKNTVIYSRNGKNVLLKEVADCYSAFEEAAHITRLNGHRCVFVVAAQKNGVNIAETQSSYKPVLARFSKTLPANIAMVHHFDQAENVHRRLSGLGTDFLIALGLVIITLLPLGYRAASVVMISIPLSLAIGLVFVDALGFNLNQLSIVGLVVALGLLVDDSIVVVENIERWIREGYSRYDAAIKGTRQIGMAVIGCTAMLITAFMPLVFLPEGPGDFIRGMPVSVIMAVLASMLVSLTIIPFLASRFLKNSHGENFFLRSLKKLIHASYARILDKALRAPVATLVIAGVLFIASLQVFPVIGFSLFPPTEKPQFVINTITPVQTSLAKTDSVTTYVESILRETEEVKYYATNVGKGNPRIYYNFFPENERTDFSQTFVQLNDDITPEEKQEVISELRRKFLSHSGAKIEVKDFEQGPPKNAPVEARLLGDNLDTLRTLAAKVELILKQTPGTIYVNNPFTYLKSDISVNINRDKARMAGIHTVDIDKAVRMAIAGIEVGDFTDAEGEDYKIVLTAPREERATLQSFESVYLTNEHGQAIPLAQIADLELQTSPISIDHYNRVRMVSVSSFVQKGYVNGNVIEDVMAKLEAFPIPPGYSFMMGGDVEAHEESLGGMGPVVVLSVFSFIAILVLMFRTFKSMLIVLSVIPLGVVGAVAGLWITGNTLSFVAVVGLIALVGVEVKNSILLVDFTNQLRAGGKTVDDAVREAGELRFLPIVLTSLTAIGGLLPIAFSVNPLISPLAIVLIGGLISSTLLSRIVTPVVYKLIPPTVISDQ